MRHFLYNVIRSDLDSIWISSPFENVDFDLIFKSFLAARLAVHFQGGILELKWFPTYEHTELKPTKGSKMWKLSGTEICTPRGPRTDVANWMGVVLIHTEWWVLLCHWWWHNFSTSGTNTSSPLQSPNSNAEQWTQTYRQPVVFWLSLP